MVLEEDRRRQTRPRARLRTIGGLALAVLVGSACASGGSRQSVGSSDASRRGSPVVDRLVALPDAVGTDVVAVWVCDVPVGTTDPTYVATDVRVDLTPQAVVERSAVRLSRYFSTISHGLYDVALVPGGTIALGVDDDARNCVDRAIDSQIAGVDADADVVLAVANAEHTAVAPGGWGTAGDVLACAPDCTLAQSRRAAYVGASDFHPDWGATPPLDLVQHELGHTLGLPHSGGPDDEPGEHTSALDLMSDSASPRDVDPHALDGPDLIAIDRVALGWLPPDDLVVGSPGFDVPLGLRPSTGTAAPRLAVVPLDEHRILTVEWLAATGFHAHLPEAGVAIHLVDDSAGVTTARRQLTIGAGAPFTDLLTPGETAVVEGWRVFVRSFEDGLAQLAIERTGG